MRWHLPVNAVLLALVMASSATGCASNTPAFSEGVVEEVVSAAEASPQDEFGISHGQVDVENRYRSVVLIESGLGRCSGVLVLVGPSQRGGSLGDKRRGPRGYRPVGFAPHARAIGAGFLGQRSAPRWRKRQKCGACCGCSGASYGYSSS